MHMTLIHPSTDISLSPSLYSGPNILVLPNIQLVPELEETTYTCPICSHISISMEHFKHHLQSVHPRNQYFCKICHRKYKTIKNLRRHEKAHHRTDEPPIKDLKEPDIPCPQCPKKLSTQTALYWHVERNHTDNEKTNTCQVCGKELSDQALLKRHLETVHSLETATCSICNKTFKSVINMQRHVAVTHPPEDAEQTCEICSKTFKCSTHLRIHVRAVHSTQTQFNCDICNKEFSLKSYLLKHKKTHIDVKEVQCEICYQVYKTVDDAKRHAKRVHMKPEESTKMKTHKCDICEKEFTRTKYLFFHKKTHFEKTFSCKFCHKLFKCNSHVNRHTKRVHTKPRVKRADANFYCDICNKAFSKKKNLVKHIQIHMILKKEAPCGICNKLFRTKIDVNRHLRRIHMKDMNIKEMIEKNKNMKINTQAKIKKEEISTTENIDNSIENADYTEALAITHVFKAPELTDYSDKIPTEDYRLATLGNVEYVETLQSTECAEQILTAEHAEEIKTLGIESASDFIEDHYESADKALQGTYSKLSEGSDDNKKLPGETFTSAKHLNAATTEVFIENNDSIEVFENAECENEQMNKKSSRNTHIIEAAIESSSFNMEELRMRKDYEQSSLNDDRNEPLGITNLLADITDLTDVAKNTPVCTELSEKIGNIDIIKAAIDISDFSMEDLGIDTQDIVYTEVENKVFTRTVISEDILESLESTEDLANNFIEALEIAECSEKTLGNTDIIKDAIDSSNFTMEDLGLTEYTEDPLATDYAIEDFGITECAELESTEFEEETLTSTDFIDKALSSTDFAKDGSTIKKTIKNTDLLETLSSTEFAEDHIELEDVLGNEFTDQALESTFFIDVLGTELAKKAPTKLPGKVLSSKDIIEALTGTDFIDDAISTVAEADNSDYVEQESENIEYASEIDDLGVSNKTIANTDVTKEAIDSSDFTIEDFACTDYATNEMKEYTEADLKSIEIKLLKCLKCGIDFENDVDLHTHLCGGEMALFLDFPEM
ncbi:uncharacterized protein LOC125239116 [Leguminivora glycinivorella]|uniref:uncharacterized protein LOC125239116 n=1 Tax=Leguminivora glycinivorella TaxID=1035111 RepID=UPI00200D2355|nr:uncharacterized protein LOC125239116 [Leguminivora glycinivorella]